MRTAKFALPTGLHLGCAQRMHKNMIVLIDFENIIGLQSIYYITEG
jgi:hypothetical protein